MDAGPDYGKMFIVKDQRCEAKWHERLNPANPAVDPYFPIGQASLGLAVDGAALRVSIRTMTPNFREYRVRIDGGDWKTSGDASAWTPHRGSNTFEAKTVNRFGVEGPVSTVQLDASN
jgi:hypothetical protein